MGKIELNCSTSNMDLISVILLCMVASTFGAPKRYNRRYNGNNYGYRKPSRQQQHSYESYESESSNYYIYRGAPRFAKTKQGIIPLAARNALSLEERNKFLPVMKALVKVMETSTPAPEDVNSLLVLTRDLTKDLPKGSSALPSFNGFNINEMGLMDDGDVIVDVLGEPHILTKFGAFPLSDVSLMTDEEREKFLPATKTFISVLEKDTIDQDEINKLLSQSEELKELIPEQWRDLIDSSAAPASNVVNARVHIYTG